MKRRALAIIIGIVLLSGIISSPAVLRAKDTADRQQKHEKSTENARAKVNRGVEKITAGIRKAGAEARTGVNRLYDESKKKQAKAPKGPGGNAQGKE